MKLNLTENQYQKTIDDLSLIIEKLFTLTEVTKESVELWEMYDRSISTYDRKKEIATLAELFK